MTTEQKIEAMRQVKTEHEKNLSAISQMPGMGKSFAMAAHEALHEVTKRKLIDILERTEGGQTVSGGVPL